MKKEYEELKYRLITVMSADIITESDDTQDDNFDPAVSDISW